MEKLIFRPCTRRLDVRIVAYTLTLQKCLSKASFVIPAKAGIQGGTKRLDSRFRGNDRKSQKV